MRLKSWFVRIGQFADLFDAGRAKHRYEDQFAAQLMVSQLEERRVLNIAPVINVDNGVVIVPEGSTAENTGAYDDGDGDPVTLTASVGIVTDEGAGRWSWEYGTNDGPEDTQMVTITATDPSMDSNQITFLLNVDNVAPTITLDPPPPGPVTEGDTVMASGTFSDPGDDTVTLTANIGAVTDEGGGTWSWTHTPTDGPISPIVLITATDSDGLANSVNFPLVVNNAAPQIANDGDVFADEQSIATNTGTFSDPGDDNVVLAASIGMVTDDGGGTWSWSAPVGDGPANFDVVITADDGDGGTSQTTFNVTVNNVAPTIVNAGDVTVSEGDTAFNNGTYNDPGNDPVNLTASIGTVDDTGGGNWVWSFNTTDGPDETQIVTITATDINGGSTDTTFQLTVNNVAPTIDNDGDVTGNEGQPASNTGNFSDVGDDTVTLTASVGTVNKQGNSKWRWSFTPTGAGDSQMVTITATDSDGNSTDTTFQFTVNNVPPTIDNSGNVTVKEGETANNTGTYTDAGGAAVSLSASVGTVTDNGNGTWSWSFAPTDGPEDSQTVTITVTDSDGVAAQTSFELTVNNDAPTIANAGNVSVNEGGTATNTGTVSDPGNDTVTLSANLGTVTDNGNGTWSWSFDTTDGPAESQSVIITATDSDGDARETSFIMTVNNVDPVLGALSLDQTTINENGSVTLSGSVTDVGTLDTQTVVITWGDGNTTTLQDSDINSDGTFSATHQYLDDPTGTPDTYTINVTATDKDSGTDMASTSVTVNNVAPGVAVTVDTVLNRRTDATLNGTITDVGSLDTHVVVIDWGDNRPNTTLQGSQINPDGTFTATRSYRTEPGRDFMITVTVTDDDGGVGQTTANVRINEEPEITAPAEVMTAEEMAVPVVGISVADPDAGTDPVRVTIAATNGTVTLAQRANLTFEQGTGTGDTTMTFTGTLPAVNLALTSLVFSPDQDFNDNFGQAQVDISVDDQIVAGVDDTETVVVKVAPRNDPPSVTTVDPTVAVINEGDTAQITGSFTEVDIRNAGGTQEQHTVMVDWGDGVITGAVVDQDADTFTATHPYLENPPGGDFTVKVTVTDEEPASDMGTTTVTVNNAAPKMQPVALDTTAVDEGGTATVSGSFTDAGTQDTHSVMVDWGDGTTSAATVDQDANTYTASHVYDDDGTSGTPQDDFSISVTTADDETAFDNLGTTITVRNVDPVVAPLGLSAAAIDENGSVTLTGNFADPGADTHTVVIDWGDGTDTTTLQNSDITNGTFSASHQYLDDDPSQTSQDDYTINVTVTDDDTGPGGQTTTITVVNVTPELTVPSTVNVSAQGEVTISGTVSDVGSLDSHTLNVVWGDNDPSQPRTADIDPATGEFTISHRYNGNPDPTNPVADIPILFTLDDDDGAIVEVTVTGTVPSEGLSGVEFDTTPGFTTLLLPVFNFEARPTSDTTVPTTVQGATSQSGRAEVVTEDGRRFVLRVVSPDGRESEDVELPEDILERLKELFGKLWDDRYRIVLIREDGSERLVIDVYVRQGRSVDPGDDVQRVSKDNAASQVGTPTNPEGAEPAAAQEQENNAEQTELPVEKPAETDSVSVTPASEETHAVRSTPHYVGRARYTQALATIATGTVGVAMHTSWAERVDEALARREGNVHSPNLPRLRRVRRPHDGTSPPFSTR